MDRGELGKWSRLAAEWGAAYRDSLRQRRVRASTMPGAVAAQIDDRPPETGEPMEGIFADFENIVVPGMTHWQHPRFFAYFPSNAAPASVVAEILTSSLAAQCMLWQTSPAATELETKMLDWLRQATGLPEGFAGVIQDSASSATLVAILTMRERAHAWKGNSEGLAGLAATRIYCSQEVHSSIDRAVWIAGIGQANLVKLPATGSVRAVDTAALEAAIERDRHAGLVPAGIVASVGGTAAGGSDDVAAVCEVARRHDLYVHVDAAWAGAAMICEEFRPLWAGAEAADSVVFNPHKWLGAQFDCTAHFLREPEALVRTLAIRPSYLQTHGKDGLIDYSEWSVPLGRRFRALKIWFLLRAYGLEGLRLMIRNHVAWSRSLCERLRHTPGFEITSEPVLSLFTFRYLGDGNRDPDRLNQALVDAINDDGRIYVTQTRLDDRLTVRFQVGQFDCEAADVSLAGDVITAIAAGL